MNPETYISQYSQNIRDENWNLTASKWANASQRKIYNICKKKNQFKQLNKLGHFSEPKGYPKPQCV